MKCPNCGAESRTQLSCSNCDTLLEGSSSSESLELDTAAAHVPPAPPAVTPVAAINLPDIAPEPYITDIPSPERSLNLPRWRLPGISGVGLKGILGGALAVATGVALYFVYTIGAQQKHSAGSSGLMLLGGEIRPAMVNTSEAMLQLGRSAADQVSAPDADRARILAIQRSRFETMEEARALRANRISPNDRPIMDALALEARHVSAALRALEAGNADTATAELRDAEAAMDQVKTLDASLPPTPPGGESDLGIDQLLTAPARRP